ncbi:MAG: GAF domain-containing protein [Ignavibacteria bacterium]|nr:GAF domain-containing protein [Ignavibacteria bacterium]
MSIFLIDLLIVKIILTGVLLIIISLIIFLRNGADREQKLNKVEPEETNEDKNSEEEKIIEDPTDKILTDYDLQESLVNKKIVQFIPQDLNEEYRKIALEPIPGSASVEVQFNFILEKVLDVIKHVFLAHSAIFFWYRRDKNQIIFHNFSSEANHLQKIKYTICDDIISRVIKSGNPNYTCNINSNVESDLIKYYSQPIGIKSIAAVPVFLNEKVIGVLAIDSKSEDAFGPETIFTLGKFVRMITLILSIYDEKFNIELANLKLDAILELIGNSSTELNEKKLIQNIMVVLDKFLEWDVFGVVLYDINARTYILKKLVNRTSIDYMGENLPVDISPETLVGYSFEKNKSIRIDDSSSSKYFLFRKNVQSNIKGSIIIVPISSNGKIHGALVLESLKKKIYSDEDVRLIEKISNYFANQLDFIFNNLLLENFLSIDLETKLMNKVTFEKRVQEELNKFKTTNMHIGLALISVDKIDKLVKKYSSKIIPVIAKHVSTHLTKEAEELMMVGRLENLKFGVLFMNRDSTADNVWCQKILQKISGSPVKYNEDEFSISVSIGYAGGIKLINADTLFNSAETALSKAINDGGGKIRTLK